MHNWFLKIFSLVLATLLWMAVARESSSEIGLDVPLEYRNIPEHLEITGDAANTVHVRLRGSSNVIKGISAFNLERTITKSVRVIPTVLGQPAEGYEIGQVLVNPGTVRIEGPESRVATIDSLPTVPIRVDHLQAQATQEVDLDVPDPQIRLQRPSPVEVRLNVLKKH